MRLLNFREISDRIGRLSKKERLILYLAICFVSLTLLDRSVISPIYSRIKSLNSEIKEREMTIKKNLRILAQEERIASEIAQYSTLLASAKFAGEDATALLKEIEDLANKSSVYLVNMRPAGSRSLGASSKLLINLNCEAQMEQLADFMYNIETSDKLLTIERYQISPKAKGSSVVTCSMTIAKIIMP